MKKIIISLILLLGLSSPAWAAPSQGIKIAPLSFDLNALPGQKIENIVKVSNPSDHEIAVTGDVQDFAPQGEEGGIEISPGYKYGLSKYIAIFPRAFSLKPGELQFVSVTIDLPKDVPAGARSGAVLFGSAGGVVSGSGSVVSGQVGALFVLNILGDLKDQARIASVAVPAVSGRGPVSLDLRIQNTGASVVKFKGTVDIYNLLGSKVGSIDLGPNNILPGAIRKFGGQYGERDPFGIYRAEVKGTFGTQAIGQTIYFAGASPNYLGPIGILGLVVLTLAMHRRKKSP